MSAHENKENTKRSARTTRATHPVWVRMEPRSLTKKKLKRKMIRSPQNNQNLPTIYNLAHALETVKTKRKELILYVGLRGAHGEPDADLARSFGHADQHDVHHANAADQERHGSDTGQHQSERVTGFFLCLEGILGTANVEVLHFAGENVMA